MSQLIGIEIDVGGTRKFVGKVGMFYTYTVFYREVPWRDVYSYKTESISVDKAAWDAAALMGAEMMVVYCPDKACRMDIAREAIEASPVIDLGERSQYRIGIKNVVGYRNEPPVKIGYTRDVRLAESIIQALGEPPQQGDAVPAAYFTSNQVNRLFNITVGDRG